MMVQTSCSPAGDITHAKFADERSSQQFEEEWQTYGDITRETGVRERQPWLDIRGNHGEYSTCQMPLKGVVNLRSGEACA